MKVSRSNAVHTEEEARDAADPSDQALMARVQRGDGAALDQLLTRHVAGLHGYLYRMCGNPADAQELSQEAFLRVWQRAGRWQPGRVAFSTWLYRIAHNLCIDQFRKQRRLQYGEVPDAVDPQADPAGDYQTARRDAALRAAVARLPDRQRSALLLCQFQGMSNRQAAEVLDVSIDAVESLLARARRSLRDGLQDQQKKLPS